MQAPQVEKHSDTVQATNRNGQNSVLEGSSTEHGKPVKPSSDPNLDPEGYLEKNSGSTLPDAEADVPEIARGKTIVDWEGPDDPLKPMNWPLWKKVLTTCIISVCTTSLYMGAAIITPAQEELQQHFDTTRVKTALGITLFVWGYGLGSLWFTPMSEIPFFRGRNLTYFGCQLVFACLQIPTALSNHIAPYAVLRFLAGIFASPPLATAGATLGDIWEMPVRVVALIIWAYGAIAGPFLGPLIGAALTQGHGFRYIFWFLLAVSGGLLVIMLLFLPETSEQELLIRKARKLRKSSGSDKFIAPGEIIMHTQTTRDILKDMFYKPIKLTIMEPVMLLMDLHIGLVYSVMYLFLEALPIVYLGMYGFNLVQMGLAFLSFLIGAAIASVLYLLYVFSRVKEMDHPERVFGRSSIFGAVLLPIALLVWGWLERKDIFWAIGMIGNLIFSIAAFFMFQSYFAFLATMFPPSAVGSAFASNNIVRSLMGGAFPLFGTVFFNNTATERYPVGWGCSILALAAIIMIPLPIYLYVRGEALKNYAQQKYGDKLMR